MSAVEDQLHVINLRIDRLEEALLGLSARLSGSPSSAVPSGLAHPGVKPMDADFQDTSPKDSSIATSSPPIAPARVRVPNTPKPAPDVSEITVTQVMGWTGATLLVLAMAYLIRLVYDVG